MNWEILKYDTGWEVIYNKGENMYAGILKKAIEEAESSDYHPYKIGAVIFKGSRILSSGHNEIRGNQKIHPKYKYFDNTLHAEQAAILNLKDWNKAKNSNILIVRLNHSNNLSIAYPCPMCQQMIKHLQLNKVFYSTRQGEIFSVKVNGLDGTYLCESEFNTKKFKD